MDWLVEYRVPGAVQTAQSLIVDHLRRHAVLADDVSAATPLIEQALGSRADGALWVRLDWGHAQADLTVRSCSEFPSDLLGPAALADGVAAADRDTETIAEVFGDGPTVQMTLPVTRGAEVSIDLVPDRLGPLDGSGYTGAVAAVMAGRMDLGTTLSEAASVAGATAAKAAADGWARTHGGRSPQTARDLAQAFVEFVNQGGAGFYVVEAGERQAVVANRACPFGSPVNGRHVMCRTTSGLLGSLAARVNTRATVSLDESIAMGDHRCRAVLDLDVEPTRWVHAYQWPPAGPVGHGDASGSRGFRVAISLQLPRDRRSVPLIRHTVANSLREVGVFPDDVHSVELAVSEAAGNVVRHADRSDAYDVEVTIGPQLAELRVVDVGRGFDSESIEEQASDAGRDAEHGRGLALMHALVDQARFTSAPERGTIVHLVKQLRYDEEAPARRLMLQELTAGDRDADDEDPWGPLS